MNPWLAIELSDYENHMCFQSVYQLQTLNEMMEGQINKYGVKTVMILGVAGGNGLNHINPGKIDKVYGVDINSSYLDLCCKRYESLSHIFEPIQIDLTQNTSELPKADLLVADLLLEYIGLNCFDRVIDQVQPEVISCILQADINDNFVSDSPYLHVFDRLEDVYHAVTVYELTRIMFQKHYELNFVDERLLPNYKKLLRLDYRRPKELSELYC